jgi:hypothetical protein
MTQVAPTIIFIPVPVASWLTRYPGHTPPQRKTPSSWPLPAHQPIPSPPDRRAVAELVELAKRKLAEQRELRALGACRREPVPLLVSPHAGGGVPIPAPPLLVSPPCLCTTVGGKLYQWYNYPVWTNPGFPKNIVVPITPQPPPAVPLADLICTACPPGCSMEIVTV